MAFIISVDFRDLPSHIIDRSLELLLLPVISSTQEGAIEWLTS